MWKEAGAIVPAAGEVTSDDPEHWHVICSVPDNEEKKSFMCNFIIFQN